MHNEINTDTNKIYAGFTIGPIFHVLSHSRKTRELWFGSYFFSWYMEELIKRFIQKHGSAAEFLIPYLPPSSVPPSLVGRFLDRFVMSSSLDIDKIMDDLNDANNETMKFFSDLTADHAETQLTDFFFNKGSDLKDAVFKIFSNYLQTRFVALPASEIENNQIIDTVYKALDTLEEYEMIEPGKSEHPCDICKILPGIGTISALPLNSCQKNKKLRKGKWVAGIACFGETKDNKLKNMTICPVCFIKLQSHTLPCLLARIPKKYISDDSLRYPSLSMILTRDIFVNSSGEIQNKLYKILDKDKDDVLEKINGILEANHQPGLKTYNKYYAIVQADGDSLGKLARSIGNPTELSKRLYDFSNEAEEIITLYGGVPVYLGGDDILAFMPVFYEGETILDFVESLQEAYNKIVGNKATATMSFGIAMAYYKFPLSDSLEKARDLLFLQAKNKRKEKNCVAISLIRHSGSEISFVSECGSDKFKKFDKLLESLMTGSGKIPRLLSYKLAKNRYILEKIPDEHRLKAFFDNVIRDQTHGTSFQSLDKVFELMKIFLFSPGLNRPEALNEVIQLLQFLRFLTEE